MRAIAVLSLAFFVAAGSVTGAFAQRALATDTPIAPLPEGGARYYPDVAQRMEANGWARLRCVPKDTGAVTDCVVVGEAPQGMRFGMAATRLARIVRVRPEVLASVVGKPSYFMINFATPNGRKFTDSVLPPKRAVIEASRPGGADAIGMASLSCRAPLSGTGDLADCAVQAAGPAGQGFEAAALALATQDYRADLGPMPREVTFWLSRKSFSTEAGAPFVAQVQNARATAIVLKDPAAPVSGADLSEFGVALTCQWRPDGGLQLCRAEPSGEGATVSSSEVVAMIAAADRLRLVRRVEFNINWGQ